MKKGPGPSWGSAFLAPPPVSSSTSRSSEMIVFGAPAGTLLHMRFDLLGQVMDVDDRRLHAGRGQPIQHMVDQRPPRELHQRLRHACR